MHYDAPISTYFLARQLWNDRKARFYRWFADQPQPMSLQMIQAESKAPMHQIISLVQDLLAEKKMTFVIENSQSLYYTTANENIYSDT